MVNLALLVGFPLIAAFIVLFLKTQKALAYFIRSASGIIIVLSVAFAVNNYGRDMTVYLSDYAWIKYIILFLEACMAAYIISIGIINRKYLAPVFAFLQIASMLVFEFSEGGGAEPGKSLIIDKLSVIMILIVGIIGSLICIYAVEYMKDYHRHHPEIKDRRGMFYFVLLVFMSAMFGLVICNDMTLMVFCWEITTLCSFLLIGYSRTKEAKDNSFRALTVNAFGGLLFTAGIIILGVFSGIIDFESMLSAGQDTGTAALAVFLISVAALTKSAQMPFSKWLLGAMVAPTPTSAMLHSSTMVKAGVYLIIRLSPMLGKSAAGISVTMVGGVTFLAAAVIAVSQSDAKKILAYSTISNLGLIIACAGINTAESVWAAIMLIIFHAVAKSLLFITVGSSEHQLGSRNVEDMDGFYKISAKLTMFLIIGIAGMFIAPFGMLISKWAAMKAFLDYGNIVIVLITAFGSTITFFFWTKWLGKLVANTTIVEPEKYKMRLDENISLYALSAMVIITCVFHPLVSQAMVIPYIDNSMHIHFSSPIDRIETTVIILMMFILFILSFILIPIYNTFRVAPTSLYLSGENAGDNKNFNGSMGELRRVEHRNWYLNGIFGEKKWFVKTQLLCSGILAGGLIIILGFGGII